MRMADVVWFCAFALYVAIGVRLSRIAKKHFLGTECQWMGEGDLDPGLYTAEGRRWLRISQSYSVIGAIVVFGWLALIQ